MENREIEKMRGLMDASLNQRVTYSRAGGGAGSIWLIKFENGTDIMIWCAWRMEKDNLVLTTWTDDATANVGSMAENVNKLEKERVRLLSYELSNQYDLTLHFENGYCVKVFCDIINPQDSEDINWEYTHKKANQVLEITGTYQVRCGEYNKL